MTTQNPQDEALRATKPSPEKCKNSDYGNGKLDWQYCGICDGRVHEPDCKSRKVKGKDCFENHTEEEYKEAGYQ